MRSSKCGTEVALALSVSFDNKLMSNGVEGGGYWGGGCVVFKSSAISR